MKIVMLEPRHIPSQKSGVESIVDELITRMVYQGHDVIFYYQKDLHISSEDIAGAFLQISDRSVKTVLTLNKKVLATMTASISSAVCNAF